MLTNIELGRFSETDLVNIMFQNFCDMVLIDSESRMIYDEIESRGAYIKKSIKSDFQNLIFDNMKKTQDYENEKKD